MSKETKDTAPKEIKKRLEQLRKALRAENISYGELAELQSLSEYIDPSDVELLEAAGVPEFVEVGDKVEIVNGANKGIVGHVTTIDKDAPFHITIKTEGGHLLYGLKKNNLSVITSDSQMAKGGKVKLKNKKPTDKKKKAIDLLISNIKYHWRNTDMGSGYEFILYAPFGTGINQRLGDVLEKRSYLDIYDGGDDYSFEDWKSDMFQSSFDNFKERVIPEYLHFFEEHLQRDSDHSSGGSMATGGEAKKTLKKGDTVQVLGKKWFDKVNGNTYHSVAVYVNNEFVGKNDFEYGYDRQYEETGRKILEQHYNMPKGMGETDSLWRLNNYGVKVLSNACNVSRKKDLVQYEMGGTAGGSDFWSSYANDGALITGGSYSNREKKEFGGFLLGLGIGSIGGYVYRDQITKTKEKAKWKTMEAIDRLGKGGRTPNFLVEDIDKEIGTSDLKERAKKKVKAGDTVIHFGYTDYGGSFMDRVLIEYFMKNYPKNTIYEHTIYNGMNAFVFGKPAKEFAEEYMKYPLGFEDTESFYMEKEREAEEESFKYFLDDIKDKYEVKEGALEKMLEERSGYWSVMSDGRVDFSYDDAISFLEKEGLIEAKK